MLIKLMDTMIFPLNDKAMLSIDYKELISYIQKLYR